MNFLDAYHPANWDTAYSASHARSHTLLSTDDHSDVATYLDQAVKVASTPQFARIGVGVAADATDALWANGSLYAMSPYPGNGNTPATRRIFFENVGNWGTRGAGAGLECTYVRYFGDSDVSAILSFYSTLDNTAVKRMEISAAGLVSCLAGHRVTGQSDCDKLHVGGTSDPGDNNLIVDGNVKVGARLQGKKGTNVELHDKVITLGDGNFFDIAAPAEIVVNGTFDEDDHWTKDGSATIGGGIGETPTYDTSHLISQAIALVVGRPYTLRFTIANSTDAATNVRIRPAGGGTATLDESGFGNGSHEYQFVATTTSMEIVLTGKTSDWDNVSITDTAVLDGIATAGWQEGSQVTIRFNSTLSLGGEPPSGYAPISGTSPSIVADVNLTLIYDGSNWAVTSYNVPVA